MKKRSFVLLAMVAALMFFASAAVAVAAGNDVRLRVGVLGNGTVTLQVNNGPAQPALAEQFIVPGSTITLTPVPGSGSVFSGWMRDYAGSANPLTFIITQDTRTDATFLALPPPPGTETFFLSTRIYGRGSTILNPPEGIDGYATGTVVDVLLEPEPGWVVWKAQVEWPTNSSFYFGEDHLRVGMDARCIITVWFTTTVGSEQGAHTITLPSIDSPISLVVNTTSGYPRDQIDGEWFLFTQVINGTPSPIFLLTGAGNLVQFEGISSLTSATAFPFGGGTGSFPITTSPITLSDFGLSSRGDLLAYAYACRTLDGELTTNITVITLR